MPPGSLPRRVYGKGDRRREANAAGEVQQTMEALAERMWQQHGERYRQRLAWLIAQRPVSSVPEAAEGRAAVAGWFRDEIAAALGLPRERVEEWPTEIGPYLFADAGRPGPTIGFYWHLDVQPVGEGQEAMWTHARPHGPPARAGPAPLWGRGSCDDLGLGLAAWMAIKEALPGCPYNLQFLISTGEESGDKPLGELIDRHRDRLTAEAWFIPDSSRQGGHPAINLSLRGLARFHLEVQGPAAPMHSGVVGGACPDPVVAAFQLLGPLVDWQQRLTLPDLTDIPYDADLERDFVAASPDREEFLRAAGVPAATGGPGALGLTLWRRPSLTIHAVETGVPPYLNAVASTCRVYFSLRVVPGQDPQKLFAALQAWVAAHPIPGIRATVAHRPGDLTEGTQVPRVEPWVTRLREAMEASYVASVLFNGSGGTEPVVGLLARILQRPAYMMGLGGAGEHGPNEHLLVEEAAGAMATVARLLGHSGT
jgi:acetylornithine deacetylase/succinyl-diaminopimelate desuccinylase-like protein